MLIDIESDNMAGYIWERSLHSKVPVIAPPT